MPREAHRRRSASLALAVLSAWALAPGGSAGLAGLVQCDANTCDTSDPLHALQDGDCAPRDPSTSGFCDLDAEGGTRSCFVTCLPFHSACAQDVMQPCWDGQLAPLLDDSRDGYRFQLPAGTYDFAMTQSPLAPDDYDYTMCIYAPGQGVEQGRESTQGIPAYRIERATVTSQLTGNWSVLIAVLEGHPCPPNHGLGDATLRPQPPPERPGVARKPLAGLAPGAASAACDPYCQNADQFAYCWGKSEKQDPPQDALGADKG